ncbi:MAG: hypothetical protein, partial [Olavius algarvensis Gamma 1 endosymbiont]
GQGNSLMNCVRRIAARGISGEADRIKAVVALAIGWTAEEVAELLQIDPNTVR